MDKTAKYGRAADHQKSDPAKNFGLTPEAFEQLVADMRAGGEELFQTIFLAHFKDCQVYLQRKNNLDHERAYDVTMDTLLVFRRKIMAGKIGYGNLRFLFTQMAHQLFLKGLRNEVETASLEIVGDWADEEPTEEFPMESKAAFKVAWQHLGEGCQGLLKRFYYEETTLQDIAEDLQKSAASIRKRKQRCMEKLRSFFSDHYTH